MARRDDARMQGFSDGVFAFAATLLVVTLEVPSDYDDLLDALAGFPALALAFAAIVSLWAIHRSFFDRYPLGDSWSVAINAALLFVVLLYVYPLKLLAELAAGRLFGIGTAAADQVEPGQLRGVYLVFGAAVVVTSFAIAALHLRAWQLRDELGLDGAARRELVASAYSYLAIAATAGASMVASAAGWGASWGMPIWLLLVASPVIEVVRRRVGERPSGPRRARSAPQPPDHATS